MYGYNNYSYPMNYQTPSYMQRGFNAQPQQMQQPQQMPQMQPTYETPIQDLRFVTEKEAEAYILMPNSRALLIDKNGMAYLKSADAVGQSQTQYFKFEQVNADGSPIKPIDAPQQINFDDYIKKDQLQNLGFVTIDEHKKILDEIAELKKMIASKGTPKTDIAKGI